MPFGIHCTTKQRKIVAFSFLFWQNISRCLHILIKTEKREAKWAGKWNGTCIERSGSVNKIPCFTGYVPV